MSTEKILSVGGYGKTVTVERRSASPNARLRWREDGRYITESLGYPVPEDAGEGDEPFERARDDALAKKAEVFGNGNGRKPVPWDRRHENFRKDPTLANLFRAYVAYLVERGKTDGYVQKSKRRANRWVWYLSRHDVTDPAAVGLVHWEGYARWRSEGRVPSDAEGPSVAEDKRDGVANSVVRQDLRFLRRVYRWASRYPTATDPLRETDETAGEDFAQVVREYPVRNQRRPVMTRTRYEALLDAAPGVGMQVYREGRPRQHARSWLTEILQLAWLTGRRISSILALRADDLLDEKPADAYQGERLPAESEHGWLRWRAKEDKVGALWVTPITPSMREVLDTQLARLEEVGLEDEGWLFPAPKPQRGEPHADVYRATQWLEKAEDGAGLETQDGGAWHPFRRSWATRRKQLPAQDIALIGGWTNTRVLVDRYLQADRASVMDVATFDE